VNLAARGARQLGTQVEKIEDPFELAQVRRQAVIVYIKSFIAAVVLTFIAYLLPW
jgi:hypothetical protein